MGYSHIYQSYRIPVTRWGDFHTSLLLQLDPDIQGPDPTPLLPCQPFISRPTESAHPAPLVCSPCLKFQNCGDARSDHPNCQSQEIDVLKWLWLLSDFSGLSALALWSPCSPTDIRRLDSCSVAYVSAWGVLSNNVSLCRSLRLHLAAL